MDNNKDSLDKNKNTIETYLGIQADSPDDMCPSICFEFNISPRLFVIALALSFIEKSSNCDIDENDENESS